MSLIRHTYHFCQSMGSTTRRHHHDVDSCEHPSHCVYTQQYLSLYQRIEHHPTRSVHLYHRTGCTSYGQRICAYCQQLHAVMNYCKFTTFRSFDNELITLLRTLYNLAHQLNENGECTFYCETYAVIIAQLLQISVRFLSS